MLWHIQGVQWGIPEGLTHCSSKPWPVRGVLLGLPETISHNLSQTKPFLSHLLFSSTSYISPFKLLKNGSLFLSKLRISKLLPGLIAWSHSGFHTRNTPSPFSFPSLMNSSRTRCWGIKVHYKGKLGKLQVLRGRNPKLALLHPSSDGLLVNHCPVLSC